MKWTLRIGKSSVGLCLLTAVFGISAWAQEYSHARIVRLSFVEGTVAVQRPDVSEWSSAPANTPIQEGFKLSTAESSFAEVEFENDSTARLGELSLVEFTQLALSPSGGKVNRLALTQGYATFNFIPEGEDTYEVTTGTATLVPYAKTMFRVDIDQGVLRVTVFKGSVDVSSASGAATIAKGSLLEVRPGTDDAFKVSQDITKDEWDNWVDQREEAAMALLNKHSAGFYSSNASSSQYGWNDLWNYGDWSYVPGQGYGWFPTVGAGWVPFSNGRWVWYPGLGYTWIAAEPWGWLPFHCGEWNFINGWGWSWFPSTCDYFSAGNVIWFEGPGWIGWAPCTNGRRGGGATTGGTKPSGPKPSGPIATGGPRPACHPAQTCTTAVHPAVFQADRIVSANTRIRVNPDEGAIVKFPSILPTRSAMLPGSIAALAAERSGAAFDPVTGRFVNSNNSRPVPRGSGEGEVSGTFVASGGNSAATAAPAGEPERNDQVSVASRPAPVRPPVVVTQGVAVGSHGGWGPSTGHHGTAGDQHSSGGSFTTSGSSHGSSGGGQSGGGSSGGGGHSGGGSSGGGGSSSSHSSGGSHH